VWTVVLTAQFSPLSIILYPHDCAYRHATETPRVEFTQRTQNYERGHSDFEVPLTIMFCKTALLPNKKELKSGRFDFKKQSHELNKSNRGECRLLGCDTVWFL
jgi:hypothetical protein